jgi:IS30 family transposase
MDEVLKKLYYDPKSGYINLVSLYEKTKELGLYYPFDDVAKWYYEQPVNQVYKKKTPVVSYNKIISHFNMVGEMQADLIDISKFYKQNSHYTFLLNVIDIYSRYAWSYPLKHKTPTEIAPYIEKIFKTIPKHNYKSLCTDKGGEFKGAVIPVLEKYNILSFSNDPNSINAKHTTALVERFNYTLWMRIKKYMYSHSTLRFVDVLDELVYNYNHTKHTTIKQKPYDVMFKNAKPYNYSNDIEKTIEHPFVIGDVVSVEIEKK